MKPEERRNLWKALNLAWEMGFIIAVPAFLFGFGGAYLDKQWGTTPIMLLLGFFIASLSSGVTLYKRVRDVLQQD